MKFCYFFCTLLILHRINFLNAQTSSKKSEPRIINGTVATAENTKYVVSIRLKRHDIPFGSGHICGGSLIGPRKVLTAAHCLYNAEKKRYRRANEFVVVMGSLNRFERTNTTIVSEVTSLAYMNTFSLDTMRDDVGLMFLKSGLDPNRTHLRVQPITLVNTTTPAGANCQVSGWGRTEKGSLSNILLTANVSTIQRSICKKTYGSGLLDGMLCAGKLLGGTDSCQGDSGGPLVFNNTLIGVVSWGTGCAQVGFPGVYTEVQYYHDWIQSRNSCLINRSSVLLLLLTSLIALCGRPFCGFINKWHIYS